MKNRRALVGEARANVGRPPAKRPRRSRHTLAVTAAVEFHGHLCLQYVVTPIPGILRNEGSLYEGDAGIAIGDDIARCIETAAARIGDQLTAHG
jgi:hypothetical protein